MVDTVYLYLGADAPPVLLEFPELDWTGSVAVMVVTPMNGGTVHTFRTDVVDSGLTLVLPNTLRFEYPESFPLGLTVGSYNKVEIFREIDGNTEKPGAVLFYVKGFGIIPPTAATVIETGPQGPQGNTGGTGPQGPQGESIQVFLVENANWPPPADANPLHVYVRVAV